MTSTSITSLTSATNSTVVDYIPEITPTNKTNIIVLATVIPVVSILIIGIVIWMRMSSSSGILTNIFRPSMKSSHQDELSPELELDSIQDDNFF
jgi:hypothetical protein